MDYKKHYDLLIARGKARTLSGYVERHHIVPKCLGGQDCPENLVELTPEEHYVAHQLLVKIYPKNKKLVYAANMMCVNSSSLQRNNKQYSWIKRRHWSLCKKRVGNKNPSFGRKWYHCPNTFESGKFLPNDVPQNWIKGRILSKEKHFAKQQKKTAREKAKLERIKYAEELYKRFVDGNYYSIQDFINSGNYSRSNEALRMLWKKYIPEYNELSSQGKPFKK